MDNNISISLFRVSSDSEYLDMIFDCGHDYHFTSLLLEARYSNEGVDREDKFDLSQVLFNNNPDFEDNTLNQRHWTVRLPLEKIGLGPGKPAIYIATFKVENNDDSQIVFSDTAICSDINNVYSSLMDGIINTDDRCTLVSDDVIRNYIILYAHQLTMQLGELDDAYMYFKMINNNFDRCGNFKRVHKHVNSCNCGKR